MVRSYEERNYILNSVIPSRLGALDALDAAIRIIERKDPDDAGEFAMFLAGTVVAKGNGYGILNPWREVGLIHGRALLEFLGLWESRGKLVERTGKRWQSDWRITDFGLPTVKPAQAIGAYQGAPEEAEKALVCVMIYANRSVAHMTDPLDANVYSTNEVRIACRGIRALVEGFLYVPLNLDCPPRVVFQE